MLTRYRQRYPQVVVDVSFEDRIIDLVDERYDLACASWRARFRWDLRASLAAPAAPDRLLSVVVALAVERAVVTARHIVEEIVPVCFVRELLHSILIEPRRIEPADSPPCSCPRL